MTRETLTIEALDRRGDGVAYCDGQPLTVPGALPGDVVTGVLEVSRVAQFELVSASAIRTEPHCVHFVQCGGCSVQHMKPEAYRDWKRGLVIDALTAHGIAIAVEGPSECQPRSRRRATFTLARQGTGDVSIGFMARGTREQIPLSTCEVITKGMQELWPVLKRLGAAYIPAGRRGQIAVLHAENGFDLNFRTPEPLSEKTKRALLAECQKTLIVRLTANRETLFQREKPRLSFGEIPIKPPPGAFAQAVKTAENEMVTLVLAHLKKAKKIADLFSGMGTFSLRLAQIANVHAIENDSPALRALTEAWRESATKFKLRKIATEKRDLFRAPLSVKELNAFDGIVFDPPRAGAEAQSKMLAKSTVPKVAAVSCNPETLSRDLRILTDGGYKLERVVAIDQFLWSSHVEAVALLSKQKTRPKRGLG